MTEPKKKKQKQWTLEEQEEVGVYVNIQSLKNMFLTLNSHAFHLQAAALENLLFGGGGLEVGEDYLDHDAGASIPNLDNNDEELLIFEDRAGSHDRNNIEQQRGAERRPVWEDPDDEDTQINVASQNRLRKLRETEEDIILSGSEYQQRLRRQHSKLNSNSGWAAIGDKKKKHEHEVTYDDEDVEELGALDGLIKRAGGLLARGSILPAGTIETTRLKDANAEDPANAVIKSIEFHPNGQLLMTSGLDKRLRFFNIDGVNNPKVQSIFLEDMPIHKAAFGLDGTHVIAAGRRKFFYTLDLLAGKVDRISGIFGREERSLESFAISAASDIVAFFGKDGHIPLVSLKSKQTIGTLKMNGTVRSGTFSAGDANELYTSGGDGCVYVWDLRMQRCRHRFIDEGSLNGTSIAASPNGQMVATGSSSGVVNLYKPSFDTTTSKSSSGREGGEDSFGGGLPRAAGASKPVKTLMQLTTTVDTLCFNQDGQMLAMGSRMKRDSLRLVHLPSGSVFSNWPTSRTPLNYVHSVAFSPKGGYVAIGNGKGRALLYRLHHYPQA